MFLLTKPWYLLKADSESNSLFPTNLSVSVSNCGNSASLLLATAKNVMRIWESKEADDPLALGKFSAVVMNLVKGLEHKNDDVYMDNYYTSVPLFLALSDKGIGACGTIRANRKFFLKAALVDEVKHQPRGTFAWRANDSLLSMLWNDHKSILFLSSIHQPEQGEPAKRKVKRVNIYQETEFLCPKLVNDYNKFMGGVDHSDQMTRLKKQKRQKKWYIRLVIKLIFMSCYDSYLVCKHLNPNEKVDYPTYKENLIVELVGFVRAPRNSAGRKRKLEKDHFRLQNVGEHFPEIEKKKKKAILRDQYAGVKVREPLKTTYRCCAL